MNQFVLLLFITLSVTMLFVQVHGLNNECPLSSQALTCTPKCKSDAECLSSGKRCCPNICNTKSCILPKPAGSSQNKYGSSSGGAGTYCGNTKCNPGEVCKMDKSSKRMLCGRP